VRKQFRESVQNELPDGIEAEFDHFLGLDDYNTDLIAVLKVSGTIGTATGKHVFLPGLFLESHANVPFVAQDTRTTPVDVQFPKLVLDEVNYHLPAGFAIESAPQMSSTTWPDHALLKIGSESAQNSVTVTRTLAYNFTILPSKEYSDLHGFYQKVAAADQQQLVLSRVPAVKGN